MKNIKYEPLEKMPLGSSWEYPPKKEQIKQALDAYKKEHKCFKDGYDYAVKGEKVAIKLALDVYRGKLIKRIKQNMVDWRPLISPERQAGIEFAFKRALTLIKEEKV